MKALCIKDTLGFVKGSEYHICPTLSGYQVTNENEWLLRDLKDAKGKGYTSKFDCLKWQIYGVQDTLKILGYGAELWHESCKVNLIELTK